MLKKITIPFIALMFLIPQAAFAHSTLEQATPAKGATITEEIKKITLTFNTKVEKGSSLELQKDGQAVEVATTKINNDQLSAVLDRALEAGTYTVLWEIIGADGHPVSGEYTFTVKSDNATKTDESKSDNEESKTEETESNKKDNTADSAAANESDEEEGSSGSLIAIIAALTVIALGSFGWMIKRGKE